MNNWREFNKNGTCFFKAPPFLKDMPDIARKNASFPASPLSLQEKREAASYLLKHQIGSYFWKESHCSCFRAILTFNWNAKPSDIRKQHQQLQQKHFKSKDILLILPSQHSLAQEESFLGSPILQPQNCNPHALLEPVREIHHFGSLGSAGDITLLGALRGITTFIQATNSQKRPLNKDDATETIFRHVQFFSPFTRKKTTVFEGLALLRLWKKIIFNNRKISACLGMSPWKKKSISHFLAQAPGTPDFPISLRKTQQRRENNPHYTVAIWASRLQRPSYRPFLKKQGGAVFFIEDGFLRSRGLGSAFTPPASITVDSRGICHDPSTPSDLEYLLEHHHFSTQLIERSQRLIERLRTKNISKYGARPDTTPQNNHRKNDPQKAHIILVPGQVHQDLSVERGSAIIKDNLTLLQSVRAENPDAWIIYRPHPDVQAGYRKGQIADQQARRYANEINRKTPITTLFNKIDELHTMTSLSGFEALIRNIPVTTWGVPFYAGWGLTRDKDTIPSRRTRRLTLAELVAATLILYPRYMDPVTNLPCPVEIILDRLSDPKIWRKNIWMYLRQWQQHIQNYLASTHAFRRLFHDRA